MWRVPRLFHDQKLCSEPFGNPAAVGKRDRPIVPEGCEGGWPESVQLPLRARPERLVGPPEKRATIGEERGVVAPEHLQRPTENDAVARTISGLLDKKSGAHCGIRTHASRFKTSCSSS